MKLEIFVSIFKIVNTQELSNPKNKLTIMQFNANQYLANI